MENDILDSLNDLGFELPWTDEIVITKALDGGPKSLEYTKLVHILADELKRLCNLEDTVNMMNDPDESSSFLLELSSFLKELGCPYKNLVTGHMSSRLQSKEDRILLLDYLLSELMAARMVNVDCPKDKFSSGLNIVMQESPIAKDLKDILMRLKFNKPPPNITIEILLSKIESKLKDMIQTEGDKLVGKPLYNKAMTDDDWKQLETTFTEMYEGYRLRRETLITRLECTIQSFEWSDRLKNKKDKIQAAYRPKKEQLELKPNVRLSDFLFARSSLLHVEKTSSATVRKNTHSNVNKVIIGHVPDRGGRPNEQQPPPPEMPSWQQRSAPQGGRGGGGRGRGDGRGGGDRGRGRVQGGYNQGGDRPHSTPLPSMNQNQRNYQTYDVPPGGYKSQGGYNQNQGGYNQNQGGYNQNQGGYNQNQSCYNQSRGGYAQNHGGYGYQGGRDNSGGYSEGYGQEGQRIPNMETIETHKVNKSDNKGPGYVTYEIAQTMEKNENNTPATERHLEVSSFIKPNAITFVVDLSEATNYQTEVANQGEESNAVMLSDNKVRKRSLNNEELHSPKHKISKPTPAQDNIVANEETPKNNITQSVAKSDENVLQSCDINQDHIVATETEIIDLAEIETAEKNTVSKIVCTPKTSLNRNTKSDLELINVILKDKTDMTPQRMTLLYCSLLKHIVSTERDKKPKLTGWERSQGFWKIKCANHSDFEWLESVVKTVKPWPNAELFITNEQSNSTGTIPDTVEITSDDEADDAEMKSKDHTADTIESKYNTIDTIINKGDEVNTIERKEALTCDTGDTMTTDDVVLVLTENPEEVLTVHCSDSETEEDKRIRQIKQSEHEKLLAMSTTQLKKCILEMDKQISTTGESQFPRSNKNQRRRRRQKRNRQMKKNAACFTY